MHLTHSPPSSSPSRPLLPSPLQLSLDLEAQAGEPSGVKDALTSLEGALSTKWVGRRKG